MSRDEMRERLEQIARNESNRSAQIQAIRVLREMDAEEREDRVLEAGSDWDDLDRRFPGLRASG